MGYRRHHSTRPGDVRFSRSALTSVTTSPLRLLACSYVMFLRKAWYSRFVGTCDSTVLSRQRMIAFGKALSLKCLPY